MIKTPVFFQHNLIHQFPAQTIPSDPARKRNKPAIMHKAEIMKARAGHYM
jgi:hypothetical protein